MNLFQLYNILSNSITSKTISIRSYIIIIINYKSKLINIYYIYFYTFNYRFIILEQLLGNYIRDQKYNIVRFKKEIPIFVQLS